MDTKTKDRVYSLADGEGPAYWFVGALLQRKAGTLETEGRLALLDQTMPPGTLQYGPDLRLARFELGIGLVGRSFRNGNRIEVVGLTVRLGGRVDLHLEEGLFERAGFGVPLVDKEP